jgi:hypothetical protein
MALAKEATVTQHISYQPFEQWTDKDDKIVLVGDAAHPTVVRRVFPASLTEIIHSSYSA